MRHSRQEKKATALQSLARHESREEYRSIMARRDYYAIAGSARDTYAPREGYVSDVAKRRGALCRYGDIITRYITCYGVTDVTLMLRVL